MKHSKHYGGRGNRKAVRAGGGVRIGKNKGKARAGAGVRMGKNHARRVGPRVPRG